VNVGELAAFQLSLTSPSHINLVDLPVTSLLIEFTDDIEPIVVRHTNSSSSMSLVRRIDLGVAKSVVEGGLMPREVQAHIRWQRRSTLVFTGMIASDAPRILTVSPDMCLLRLEVEFLSIQISRVVISLREGSWHVTIPFVPSAMSRYESNSPPLWMRSEHPLRCIAIRREHYSSTTCVSLRHDTYTSKLIFSFTWAFVRKRSASPPPFARVPEPQGSCVSR
jgi:hypothetical protein